MKFDGGNTCQRFLLFNAVTVQIRLANNAAKGSPGFSIFDPGDLHRVNLGDFPPSAKGGPLLRIVQLLWSLAKWPQTSVLNLLRKDQSRTEVILWSSRLNGLSGQNLKVLYVINNHKIKQPTCHCAFALSSNCEFKIVKSLLQWYLPFALVWVLYAWIYCSISILCFFVPVQQCSQCTLPTSIYRSRWAKW